MNLNISQPIPTDVILNEKPKRVRRSKKQMNQEEEKVSVEEEVNINKNVVVDEPTIIAETNVQEKVHKKRGRKPKGGKIIVNSVQTEKVFIPTQNIILHLKCKNTDQIQTDMLSSLTYNPDINQVETFQFGNDFGYSIIQNNDDKDNYTNDTSAYTTDNNTTIHPVVYNQMQNKENLKETINNDTITSLSSCIKNTNENDYVNRMGDDMKNIASKLKELTTNLHLNNISYKKSACFWCTFDFDNPPIYIPKYEISGIYHCYGCFCSPECATAHLFNEHIDTATRFERYHLINHIYCKIYNYTKNVKPAPNPFYLLNKYYGNLSIQEYRQLLKNERLLIVVDKPLSRTLPELHEDNDDFMFNGKTIPSSTNKFKLKRKTKSAN